MDKFKLGVVVFVAVNLALKEQRRRDEVERLKKEKELLERQRRAYERFASGFKDARESFPHVIYNPPEPKRWGW